MRPCVSLRGSLSVCPSRFHMRLNENRPFSTNQSKSQESCHPEDAPSALWASFVFSRNIAILRVTESVSRFGPAVYRSIAQTIHPSIHPSRLNRFISDLFIRQLGAINALFERIILHHTINQSSQFVFLQWMQYGFLDASSRLYKRVCRPIRK